MARAGATTWRSTLVDPAERFTEQRAGLGAIVFDGEVKQIVAIIASMSTRRFLLRACQGNTRRTAPRVFAGARVERRDDSRLWRDERGLVVWFDSEDRVWPTYRRYTITRR